VKYLKYGKLGNLLAKTRREYLLAPPAPRRLHEVLHSSALPRAHEWLLALPVPRLGQAMLAVDVSCRLMYHLCVPIFPVGAICPCCSLPMDRWGDHAVQCRVGKGIAVTYRHNAVRGILYRMAKELGLDVVRETHFPIHVPGAEGRRPDLLLKEWEGGRDLYLDVVGSSPLAGTNVGAFAPSGGADGAVARKMSDYRDIMRAQPPSVVLRAFAFETLGGLHADALEVLTRLQGRVNMAVLTCDDNVWFLVVRRVGMVIAKAQGRQLSFRLQGWRGSPSGNCPAP
jgi:hypothetical protein